MLNKNTMWIWYRKESLRLALLFLYAERAAVRLHSLEAITHSWQVLKSWHEIEREPYFLQKINKKIKCA